MRLTFRTGKFRPTSGPCRRRALAASVAPRGTVSTSAITSATLRMPSRRIGRCCVAKLPGDPFWLKQVHGTVAVDVDKWPEINQGDAAYARQPGNVCAVMTADCLPVLFCDRQGSVVAAAHAGWRGLLAGVLESAVGAMQVVPGNILAWLGPAIGPACFEVGREVRDAFVAGDPAASLAFTPRANDRQMAVRYLPAGAAALAAHGYHGDQRRRSVHCQRRRPFLFLSPRWRDRAHGQPDLAGARRIGRIIRAFPQIRLCP